MKKEEVILSSILSSSFDYIIIFDEEYRIIETSNNVKNELFGKSDFENTNFSDFINVKERKKIDELVLTLNENMSAKEYETTFVIGNTKINVIINFSILNNIKPKEYLAVIKNVSMLNKIRKKLKTEQMFMYNLMNQIPDSIYIKDKDSNFLRINKTQINTLGVNSEEEAIGKSDSDFFLPEHAAQALQDEKDIINKIKPIIQKEELIKHSTGLLKWVSTIKAPLINDKEIIGTLGITRDITDKKQVEIELRKSEALFKSIWNNSLDGMRIIGPDGSIFMVNPAFCLMFGLEENELIGQPISVIFNENHEEIKNKKLKEKNLNSMVQKIKAKKILPFFEKQLHLWNGMHVWFELSNSIFELNGENYLLSVFRDINERKISEHNLAYSEGLNKTTINALSDYLFVVDKESRIVLSNNAFNDFAVACNLTGDILGLKTFELTKTFPFLTENYFDLIFSEKKELIIFDRFMVNEINYFFEIKFIPVINDNRVIQIIILILDITDLKKYEEELRRSALIFENLNESVFIIDKRGAFVDLNYACEKLFGINRKDLIGKSIKHLINRGLNIPEIHEIFNYLSKSSKWNNKIWFTNQRTLITKHIEIEFYPLTDAKGDTIAFYSVSRDITDLTAATNKINNYIGELQAKKSELEKTSDELRLTNTSKDKFFSIIAHDLKSPFQGILGFYNLLKDDFDSLEKDEIKFMVTNIGESAKNLFSLIENLLEWSRVQLGKIECIPEVFNFYELIYSVKSLLIGNAIKKNINLTVNLGNNINEFNVYADKKMMNSVITNLVSNSIKFTKKGGKISIETEKKGKYLLVKIIDDGIGMDSKMLKSLFKIDTNISRNGTDNEKGTGLGLILCKEFVERNGGTIKVKSKINNGTNFSVTIPLAKK